MSRGGPSAFIFFVTATILAGCHGRIPLVSGYQDASGHRLYFFEDSLFIGYVGDPDQAFYKMTSVAYGRWEIHEDSSVILNSATSRTDSTCRAYNGRDVILLKGYRMTRTQGDLVPVRPYSGEPAYNPYLLEMWQLTPDKRDRLDTEHSAWNLKRFGHPEGRCRLLNP